MYINPRYLILFFHALFTITAYSQADATVWNAVTKVEENKYVINIPQGWKKVSIPDGSGLEYKFDGSGVGIPTVINEAPVYCNFTLTSIKGNKLPSAKELVTTEFSGFYDRVSEPSYDYDTYSGNIKTGEKGFGLHTRYYRRSKVNYYSKYFLVVYAPKADVTYILNLNFQYKDPTYDIERSAKMKDYAEQVFLHFELR